VYNEKLNESSGTVYVDQISEFQCSEDKATCVILNRTCKYVAVGFDSGWIRIFDIQNTTLNKSIKTSETEIINLKYSTNDM